MPETTSAPARFASEFRRYELTLGDYWRIILKRRMVVFSSFLMVLIVSILYTNSKVPIYETNSTVRVLSKPRVFDEGGMIASTFTGDPMATYANTITSDEVMRRVVIRLNLLPSTATINELMEKTNEIRGAISTSADPSTGNIDIIVTHQHPELAAAIANKTAEVFAEVDLYEKTKQARNLRRFIETQLTLYAQKLKQTEDKMSDFRGAGRALGAAMGLEQKLANLQEQRSFMLKQFTEKHPDVMKINTDIETLKEQIKELPADELELARLQRDLEINDGTYRMLKNKYESARMTEAEQIADVVLVASATVPDIPISPRKNMNKVAGALVGIVVGIVLAFIGENLDTSIGTIEDVEQAVKLPVIGVIPYFNPKAEEKPWWRFDLPVLDYFKQHKDVAPDGSFLIINQDSFSTLSESYRILRTFIEFIMADKKEGGKVLLVTSTGPQEGKTLTACNLAIVLAQGGKRTLLIDADLRRPMVHRLFGLKRMPGLSDVLTGTSAYEDSRQTMADILVGETSQWDHLLTAKMLDRLEILPNGTNTTTPAELLNSEAMKDLISDLRKRYDYILIDTPPVLPVTDARTLGGLADGTFFIYRAGKTARRALTRARDELNLAGVKVKGIILNQATPEVTLTESYYYQYYGEKKDKPKKKTPPSASTKDPINLADGAGKPKSFWPFSANPKP